MTATGHHRGHSAIYDGETWRYADGVPIGNAERPCMLCGVAASGFSEPDPCLGLLAGVRSACCGHGVTEPYVLLAEEGTK